MRSMTKWCVLASVSRTKTAIRSTTLSVAASSTTRYSSRRSRIPSSILYTTTATPSTSPFLKKKDLEPSAPPSKFRAQRLSIVSPFNTIWYAKKLAIDSSRTKSRSSLFRIVSIRPTKRRRRCWEASILVFSIMETSCWVCWWILNRFTSCLLNSTSWSTCFRMQVNINVVISQSTLFLRIYHQSRLLILKWFLRTCNRMWSRNTVTIRMNYHFNNTNPVFRNMYINHHVLKGSSYIPILHQSEYPSLPPSLSLSAISNNLYQPLFLVFRP